MASSHRTRVTMIDREGETGKQGNDDTAFPWSPFLMCPDHPMDDCIANLVLHLQVIHKRPGETPG